MRNNHINSQLLEEKPDSVPQCVFSVCCDDNLNFLNSLADEQQVDLSRINQIDVRQSVHSLQTRMDPTVQLHHNTHTHTRLYTPLGQMLKFTADVTKHTIIFRPLNSRMMQDRPTSCPAPLDTHTQTHHHFHVQLTNLCFRL